MTNLPFVLAGDFSHREQSTAAPWPMWWPSRNGRLHRSARDVRPVRRFTAPRFLCCLRNQESLRARAYGWRHGEAARCDRTAYSCAPGGFAAAGWSAML